ARAASAQVADGTRSGDGCADFRIRAPGNARACPAGSARAVRQCGGVGPRVAADLCVRCLRLSHRRAFASTGAGAQPRSGDVECVLEERARLSRELHDGFAQLVAYMLVRLDTV